MHRNFYDNFEEYKMLYSAKIQGDIKLYLFLLSKGPIYRFDFIASSYRFILNGDSWSSKYIKKPNGYTNFYKIKELQKLYYMIFKKKIRLKKRLDCAAVTAVGDSIRFKGIKFKMYALKILIVYPRVLFLIIKRRKGIKL